MTDQEKIDQITALLERYVELSRTTKSAYENDAELQQLAEQLPYEDNLDQAALKEWRKLLKSYDTGLQDDQVEHVAAIEWRWFEVLRLHGVETNWI